MFIKATRNMLIAGEHVEAGSVTEIDDETGKYLISINKATKAEKPTKKTEKATEDPK